MKPKNIKKIVLDILSEKSITLQIGVIIFKVRKSTGARRSLAKDVRVAIEKLVDENQIERFYMGQHRSQLTGVSLSPKWGYRIPREKWYHGG